MSQVTNAQTANYEKAYGILCATAGADPGRSGLYPTFCIIETGGKTTSHQHFEPECYYVIKGNGEMTRAGQKFEVCEGDLIRVAPFTEHQLRNIGDDDLSFLSVYSEDFELAAVAKSVVVTAAPPTPNGPIHLGHISGPYLAADILSRYLKLKGSVSRFECGTDDHQNYIGTAARKRNLTSQMFRTQMQARIEQGFERTNIKFDQFWQPFQDENYQNTVKHYFRRALEAKIVNLETLELPYCGHCDHVLRDATMSGSCPHCNMQGSGTCESCGLVVAPNELLNPSCSICDHSPEMREIQVYTVDLRKIFPLIEQDVYSLDVSPKLHNLIAYLKEKTLLKLIVAYPTKNNDREEITFGDHAIHVWFEMAAHYERYAIGTETWVHSFGFDNSFYYLLFIPALHRALCPTAKFMDAVVINDFLLLEGQKFSTSRGHAIWADEFGGNIDHLRLFLCEHRPQAGEENFSRAEFASYSADLSESLKKLSSMKLALITNESVRLTPSIKKAVITANRYTRDFELFFSPDKLDLRRAATRLREFLDYILHLKSDDEHARNLLINAFATVAAPIMPGIHLTINAAPMRWTNDWGNFYEA